MLRFLCPGCSRHVRVAGPQSLPGFGGRIGSDDPPAGALSVLAPEELVTQAPTSKHVPPPPLTLAAAADSCGSRSKSSQAGRTLSCYPQSKLEDGDLKLRALDPLPLRLPNRGRRGWAPGVWRIFLASALPPRANLSGAVLAGQRVSTAAAR